MSDISGRLSIIRSHLDDLSSHPLLYPVTNHTLNLNNNPNYIPPSGEIIYTSTLYGEYEDWVNLPFKLSTITAGTSVATDNLLVVFDSASVSKSLSSYVRIGDTLRLTDIFIPIENVYFSVDFQVSMALGTQLNVIPIGASTTRPLSSLSTHQRNALIGERFQLRRLL